MPRRALRSAFILVLVATCVPLATGFRGVAARAPLRGVARALRAPAAARRAPPSPLALAAKLPLPSLVQVCYGALLFTSGQGLISDALVGSFDRPVVLDLFIFAVSALSLRQTLAKVDYSKLDGAEVKSLARDAGAWALAGTVPTRSSDGRYEVATFAGGCFWGTELHFQRMPGVIATCVGYTQGAVVQPNYQQVCSGSTGHTEGIQIMFDSDECRCVGACAACARRLLLPCAPASTLMLPSPHTRTAMSSCAKSC